MLIGIEAERANHPRKTGVEHYAKQLILHLAKLDQTNRYVLYLRRPPEAWFLRLPRNFQIKIMPFPVFWTQIRLSLEMLLHPVDVLLIPASALPIIHPGKSIVTVHDIGWRYFPSSFPRWMRVFLEWSTRYAVKRAAKIIAVSRSTKRDILKFYGAGESKIAVVHHGYDEEILNPGSSLPAGRAHGRQAESEILNKEEDQNSKIPKKYILCLSTLQPRKNLEGLTEAFVALKRQHPELPHKLVVAGKPGWMCDSILRKFREREDEVIYLGYVNDGERRRILANAEALVIPSFYEGFGLPVLEAFAAWVPVAAAKASSLPEIAGEAAVYFDPRREEEIKDTIKTLLFDRSLKENLKAKGRERLKSFSWEKCARETLKLLTEIGHD